MSWATTRQLLFALGALALIVVIGVFGYFYFFYTPASCGDGVQNQNEEGVDCGGECLRLCVAPNVSTLWARSVAVAPGVYHAVGLIRNPDTSAQGIVPYEVSLFDVNNILIATRTGTITLFPGESAPLFEANIITGERTPSRTFIDITQGVFEKKERTTPPVRTLSFQVDAPRGRVTAVVENQTLFPVHNVVVTALLFDSADIITDASQTTVTTLGARERREVVFTWQGALTTVPTRVDIIPRTLGK